MLLWLEYEMFLYGFMYMKSWYLICGLFWDKGGVIGDRFLGIIVCLMLFEIFVF